MKIRVTARDENGDMREVEGEGVDYQTAKAGLLEGVPDDLQVLLIKVDRPEVIR